MLSDRLQAMANVLRRRAIFEGGDLYFDHEQAILLVGSLSDFAALARGLEAPPTAAAVAPITIVRAGLTALRDGYARMAAGEAPEETITAARARELVEMHELALGHLEKALAALPGKIGTPKLSTSAVVDLRAYRLSRGLCPAPPVEGGAA